MVLYALVIFPNINTTKIEVFRELYDPNFNLIKPHLTLIFPIDSISISEKSLSKHVRSVLNNWKVFDIELNGFKKSLDHWLFLLVKEGIEKIKQLHDELYEGILSSFLRSDLKYIPHISLGCFKKKNDQSSQKSLDNYIFDEPKYNLALKKAEELNLIYRTEVKTIQLIQIKENFTQSSNLREFPLNIK